MNLMGWVKSLETSRDWEPPTDRDPRFRPLRRDEVVERARLMCGPAGSSIVYRLQDHSGGRRPWADDPASHWTTAIRRVKVASSDCAGFVAWCLGYDRYQPEDFHYYGGWINCDSAILDAEGKQEWFAPLIETGDPERDQRALPGDVVVFPSIDLDHDGSRDRVGHIGVIVGVSPRWKPGAWSELRVAHCSSGNTKKAGQAIAETSGVIWSQREAYKNHSNPRWAARVIRYRRRAPF